MLNAKHQNWPKTAAETSGTLSASLQQLFSYIFLSNHHLTYPAPAAPVCLPSLLLPADMTRYFNVFLPAGFHTGRRYPVWMHIHGVYWGSMDDISKQMGWNVLAMDATANWDGLVGSDKVQNSAIVVYPQSTPSPYEDTSKRMVRREAGVLFALCRAAVEQE